MSSTSKRQAARTGTAGGSRTELLEAGLRGFASRGYSSARLADIAADAGLTTGAFYRHFTSKLHFFRALLDEYGDALLSSLNRASSKEEQFEAWIVVSRQYRGVIRAAAEVVRAGTEEAAARRRLRDECANLLARHIEPRGSWREIRATALLLADILDQYVLMEAAGWIRERDPGDVAAGLESLVRRGLYA
jgi:AcrR family transcriptional regulator